MLMNLLGLFTLTLVSAIPPGHPESNAPSADDYPGRRNLFLQVQDSLHEACKNPNYECESHELNMDIDFSNEEAMDHLVGSWCCVLRLESMEKIYELAFEFQKFCASDKFLQQQHSMDVANLSPSQIAFSAYCPNTISMGIFQISTYASLWLVSGFGGSKTSMLQCSGTRPNTGNTIEVYMKSIDSGFDLQHVILKVDGENLDWGSNIHESDVDMFNFVTGVPGYFTNTDTSSHTNKWTIHNVDTDRLMQVKEEIALIGKYSLVERNCAQVALQLLAAGLGCTANPLPFVPPVAIWSVLDKVVAGGYWQQ